MCNMKKGLSLFFVLLVAIVFVTNVSVGNACDKKKSDKASESYYLVYKGEDTGYHVVKVVNGIPISSMPLNNAKIYFDPSDESYNLTYFQVSMIVLKKTREIIFTYNITEYNVSDDRINSRSYFITCDGRVIRANDIAAVVVYEY
ncbi:MAG: hypothetical protein HQK49_02960 [Oligoflexia bacterium]|nr:hypothetical protein [Oligoflexia bacterium]